MGIPRLGQDLFGSMERRWGAHTPYTIQERADSRLSLFGSKGYGEWGAATPVKRDGVIGPEGTPALIVYFGFGNFRIQQPLAAMRTSAHYFRFLLVAWLCLISMADLQSIPGFVLCFGEDGHVELEVAVNDRCGSETANSDMAALASRDADHCGDCSDVPLFSDAMQSHFERPAAAPSPDFLPWAFRLRRDPPHMPFPCPGPGAILRRLRFRPP